LQRKYEVLGDPILLTRFLCGIPSPALSKARLGSNPLFGALAEVPFGEVKARIQQPG
jgi:ATP-dependent DNA helicase RecQ